MHRVDFLRAGWIFCANLAPGAAFLLPCKALQQPELDPSALGGAPHVASSPRDGFGG